MPRIRRDPTVPLTSRQLAALTEGAHRADKTVRSTRSVVLALHQRGLLIRTEPEAGRITPAGLRLVAQLEQAQGAR